MQTFYCGSCTTLPGVPVLFGASVEMDIGKIASFVAEYFPLTEKTL